MRNRARRLHTLRSAGLITNSRARLRRAPALPRLPWWTERVAVGAVDAAIFRLGGHQQAARRAVVEPQAVVHRHGLVRHHAARRTGQLCIQLQPFWASGSASSLDGQHPAEHPQGHSGQALHTGPIRGLSRRPFVKRDPDVGPTTRTCCGAGERFRSAHSPEALALIHPSGPNTAIDQPHREGVDCSHDHIDANGRGTF